jgi:hypothetical protein
MAMVSIPNVTLNHALQCLRHHNEDVTDQIVKSLGIKLENGSFDKCKSCSIAKACQKNVTKKSDHNLPSILNERVYLDRSYQEEEEHAGPYHAQLVDHC